MVLDLETTKYQDIIQIAYTIYDSNDKSIKKYDSLINEGIGKVDYYEKYTLNDIYSDGIDPIEALTELSTDMSFTKYLVCHNIAFDAKLIYKYFKQYHISIDRNPIEICTMKLSKSLCGLLNKRNRPKPPKLSELYMFCFGIEPDTSKTHTADYDIHITAKCYQYLRSNKMISV